jgi:hypothetical protein
MSDLKDRQDRQLNRQDAIIDFLTGALPDARLDYVEEIVEALIGRRKRELENGSTAAHCVIWSSSGQWVLERNEA